MSGLVTLSRGSLTLTLSPTCGGSITGFTYESPSEGKIPLFRVVEGLPSDPLDCASFPLVPFVNRVRDGRFQFRGRDVTLSENLLGDPSPLHGQGWRAAWQVARRAPDAAELVYRHAAGEWPWSYEARQTFTLAEEGLDVRLACTNLSDAPMPCGLGLHPYFRCGPDTVIDTRVECSWTIDDKVLPVEKVPAEGRFDLRERRICSQDLDHGFGGWEGAAVIADPTLPFRLRLSGDGTNFLHVYSPAQGGFFAAEPVSHANAALNAPEAEWARLGLRVLAPGETMAVGMRVELLAPQ